MEAHIRKTIALLIGIIIVALNKRFGLGLTEANLAQLVTLIVAYIGGLSIFDAAKAYKA